MNCNIVVALVTAILGLIVWFVKLILLERYQFMDKIGGEKIGNPYVMIRLDRLWQGLWYKNRKIANDLRGTQTPFKAEIRVRFPSGYQED